ncbi:hypothetical protein MMC18_004469 [Xylographa bjoerkii]|nr:hypothetical protein [Xylographa bjoerkii]
MAGSLDDLIRFLLEEIALCGEQGATPSQVLNLLDHYFKKNIYDGELTNTVDRPFQEQAWKWLSRHPEIRIGRNGEGNRMGLADVVAHNERVEILTQQGGTGLTIASTSLTANHGYVCPDTNATVATDQVATTGAANSLPAQAASVSAPLGSPSTLHVFASVNRMWLAVAGHGIDSEKIAALEFTCLSIIAARRENGILQPELVRITGQDKRSVPWRTQKLCDKGYIVKKEVVASGARTSLCILKRFAVESSSMEVTTEGQHPVSLPGSVKTGEDKGYVDAKSHIVETRLRATFDILKELKIILWDDLKMKLGIWRKALESRRFAVTIRKLEILKCVQRVRASERKDGALHRCVKLLREPTKEEYDMLCDTKHKMADFILEKEQDDIEDDLENYGVDSPTQIGVGINDTAQLDNDVPPAKVLMWTPDRLMVNILRDAVRLSGSKGMSSLDIKNIVIGTFFERPVEHLLTRLVEVWQLSQPLHLRYLAILRDTTLTGKTQHYVYYSYDVFKSLVDAGNASWEAVETIKTDNPEDQGSNAASNATPDVDDYGFPKLDKARFQGRDNDATLAESIAAAKITKFRVTAFDASVSKLQDGGYTLNLGSLHWNRRSNSNGPSVGQGNNKDAAPYDAKRRKSKPQEISVTKKPKKLVKPDKPRGPRGRPRKYPKTGLPENASGLTLEQLYAIKASQNRAMEYERSKITNHIASRIEHGEEEEDSTEYVLAEVTARNNTNPDPAVSEALESLTNATKKRKRPTIVGASCTLANYVPSVLAHSFLVPKPSEIESPVHIYPPSTSQETPTRPWKKVKLLSAEDNPKIPTPYLPSIVAHSLLVCEEPKTRPVRSAPATTLNELIAMNELISSTRNSSRTKKLTGIRKRLYRSKKFHSAVEYFPSTLAHTISNLATISQPLTKIKKMFVKPLNAEMDLANSSSNSAHPRSIRIGISGPHELNSGDSTKPIETSADNSQLLHSTEEQSDSPLASSGMLQHLVQQTRAIAPSTSRKRNADNGLPLTSQKDIKRPRTSPFTSIVGADALKSNSFESKIEYFPSVAAHTYLWYGVPQAERPMNMAATAKKMSRPRKKTAKAQDVEIMDRMMENSIAAQNSQRIRPCLTYEDQLRSIPRDTIGVYLGELALLKKSHRRGRPRQSRLIVFRSPRLSALSWFIPEPTIEEITNTETLSSIKDALLTELGEPLPKPPLDAPRSQFQLSQARGDFLSSIRDVRRLSKTTELSYITPYTAIADLQPPSVVSIPGKKRKRISASTNTPQPLRRKPNTDAPSDKNSESINLFQKEVSTLPTNLTSTAGMPTHAELATLLPLVERDHAQSVHSRHVLNRGSNLPISTFVHPSTSCTSTVAPLGVENASADFDPPTSATTITDNTTRTARVCDTSFGASEDAGFIEAQYDDAAGRTIEGDSSATGTTGIVFLDTTNNAATNQNVVQHTLLQPRSLVVANSTRSIPTGESNFARTKNVSFVNSEISTMASTITELATTSGSPKRDQIQPKPIHSITMLNSWLPGTSEQTDDGLLTQSDATPDFEASAGVSTVSSMVVPNVHLNQEDNQRGTLRTSKDTTSQVHVETTPLVTPEGERLPLRYNNDSSQVSDFVIESSTQALTDSQAAPTITRVITTGGSVAVLRRKIIMEIVDHCGGVFPGDREIWQPFCDVWKLRNGGGKPDHRTVLAAVKYLVDNGKLRKLKFTFDHEGIATTRSIVTSPDIPPTDPKVKDLRQKMIDHADTSARPKMYIPEEARVFMASIEAVDKPKRKPLPQQIVNKSWTNRLEVADERVKLQYPARLKLSSKGLLISQGMERRRKEREERQTRVTREVEEEMGEPDFEIEGYQHSKAAAPSETAGTYEFRWREFDPTTDEVSIPKGRGTTRIREATFARDVAGSSPTRTTKPNGRRLMKLQVNSRPRSKFLHHSTGDSARQVGQNVNRLRETLADGAYPQIQFMEVLDQNSNFDKEMSPELDDFDQEQVRWLHVDRRLDRLKFYSKGDWLNVQSEHQPPRLRKSKINKLHKIFHKQLQEIGIQYRVAARRRKTEIETTKRSRRSHSDLAHIRMQVSSIMDPEHLFHVTTGTFSTSFAGMLDMAEVPDVPEYPATVRFHDPIERAEVDLPCSLQDALERPYNFELVAHMERWVRVGFNPDHDPFLEQIDKVRKWELGTPNLANTTSRDWQFINFQLLEPQETAQEVSQTSVFVGTGIGGGMKQKYQRKPIPASPRPIVPAKRPVPVSKPAARRANLARPSMTRPPATKVPVDTDGRPFKKISLRGPRLQAVSSEDDRRILIAVLVVRTLVGGSEQFIDWVLLARMFGSRFSERLLHRRWVAVRVRYKRNLEKVQSDFQDMFLQAYENGTIPPLDFDNYDDYDWNSLVDWTMKNLETPVNNLNKDLPNTRTELDSHFELRKPLIAASELTQYYELDAICAVPKRQMVIHRKPHAVPIHTYSTKTRESTLPDIAKTWVRANIITPDEGYDAHLARDKLTSLGEPNLEAAVKDLLSARVILQANKGRLIPGRNYDMTEYSLTRLRRKVETHTFRQAATYKACLDTEFEERGSVEFSYHAGDGEVMAVLNLAAHGRINILPKNPPMEIFGLVENGYRTRHMDKARLNFDIELKPTSSYVDGNPLIPLPPPPGPVSCTLPSSAADTAQSNGAAMGSMPILERLPFWVGINIKFVPVAWDLALAAVLSLVAVQPGVSPEELAKTLRPALEAWEIALILQWVVQAGIATWVDEQAGKSRNGGVELAEWWWMALGREETGQEMDTREG